MERRHWYVVYWHWKAWERSDDDFGAIFDLSPGFVRGLARATKLEPGQLEQWFLEDSLPPLAVIANRLSWWYALTFGVMGALFGLLF